jgi:hypothetical protein
MATTVTANSQDASDYHGLAGLFEYTNWDGNRTRVNCAQAAAATFLTCFGKLPAVAADATQIMRWLEKRYPPDQLGGVFGTGKSQVVRICSRHGLQLTEIAGEDNLRAQLDKARPAVVMLGVSAGRLFKRFDLPGGHWMVAYGYDTDYVYLSNWGRMTWSEFRRGWSGLVPRLIRMRRKALVAVPPRCGR